MDQPDQMDENELRVQECLETFYGIRGSLSRLPGENLNYLVTTAEGEPYVFKIVDDDMPAAVVEMENAVIEHALSVGFPYHLPRIIKNRQGQIETGIKLHDNPANRSRLLEFVDGIQWDSLTDISSDLRFELGGFLANFDSAMADFEHPAAHRNHRWNLAKADQHRPKIALFEEEKLKNLLGWAFDYWAKAKKILPALPHQVIHGDAHGENVLIGEGHIVGLVDFGDCCFNPVICELGVCLPYMLMEQEDPIAIACDIIAGYHAVRPLSNPERSVLLPLIAGRMAVTVCVAEKRRTIDPDHPNWFGSTGAARRLLEWVYRHHEKAQKSLLL